MTKKPLILVGVVAVCALPAASQAQLFNTDFTGVTPARTVMPGTAVGPFFMVSSGNVDILSSTEFPPQRGCTAPNTRCVDLNGSTNGGIESTMTFAPGDYLLSFHLTGSRMIGPTSMTPGPDTTTRVSFGNFLKEYMLASDGSTTTVNALVVVPTTRANDHLTFDSLTANTPEGAGPILNSVSVSSVGVSALEPATLGLLALGLLGGAGAGFARRKRPT